MVEENLAIEGDKIMKEKRLKDATFLVSKMKEGVKGREILTALLSIKYLGWQPESPSQSLVSAIVGVEVTGMHVWGTPSLLCGSELQSS